MRAGSWPRVQAARPVAACSPCARPTLLELPERAGTLPAGAVVDALLIGDL
ncbi:MAG: hypothetical protein R2851_22865 [Caldilineaceae bacterium]